MARQATTSNSDNNCAGITMYSKGTYNMLKQVIKNLKKEDTNPENVIYSSFERAARFTGLSKDLLMKIMTEEQKDSETVRNINRKTIHYELTEFYMKERTYPTCIQLFNRLQGNIPYHVDIQTFQNTLVAMGYMFKKKGDMTVIIENPKVRFERYMYLKNIKRYRELNKDIYFVGEFGILDLLKWKKVLNLEEIETANSNFLYKYICAVSAETGKFFNLSVPFFNANMFQIFISNVLLPHLDRPCVVIYDNSKHHNYTHCNQLDSFENSLKDDIIEWLRYNNVPCNTNMSKMQLWKLVEEFTDINTHTYVSDEIIKHNGHDVLRLPNCINDLTLMTGVRQSISGQPTASFHTVISKSNLNIYNSALIVEESNILDLELELDELLDDLGDPFIDPLSDVTISGADLELPCINK